MNYELVSRGYKTVFLGQSNSIDSLKELLNYYDNINFVSYFTISPTPDELDKYFEVFSNELRGKNSKLMILGYQTQKLLSKPNHGFVEIFESIDHFTAHLTN